MIPIIVLIGLAVAGVGMVLDDKKAKSLDNDAPIVPPSESTDPTPPTPSESSPS